MPLKRDQTSTLGLDRNRDALQQISAPSRSNEYASVGVVATMPRSGTWYNNLFYNFYIQLQMGKSRLSFPHGLIQAKLPDLDLGVEWLAVSHLCCPGFDRLPGLDLTAWNRLRFHIDGYNFGVGVIASDHLKSLDPGINPKAKIIYCCRNPLDWAISVYDHARQHVDERSRYYQDENGQWVEYRDVVHFMRSMGLGSFIKQYYTFTVMRARYPRQIKFVHYEEMVRHPQDFFAENLAFLGQDVDCPVHRERIKLALAASSKQNVRVMEKTLGHSLAGDLKDSKMSHISDGAIGKWKRIFSPDDVAYVRDRLTEFDIDLDQFIRE